MESRAILRFSGLSASKMRQVADLVRGKDVPVALHSLQFVTRAAAKPMSKLISSAVANAREKYNAADERFDADLLFVKSVLVDEGPTAKRFRPRAQGRAYRIRKRIFASITTAASAPRPVPRSRSWMSRSRTGELLPFKKGGFIMAIKAQAPIVPVAIKGARAAMRKGSPIIYPVTVGVRLGEPVETVGLTLDDRDRLVNTVRDRIAAMLADM